MNIQFPKDHGRSMFEKLSQLFEKGRQEGAPEATDKKKLDRDVFEKSPVQPTEPQKNPTSESLGSELNVSFQFDLFYQLSTKVEAKMGQSGANRFAELSSEVAETFAGSFNLKIDGVGSFMKNTDSALNISPETTNEFFDAVEGLTDLSPEALENFLQETEDFFNELESVYGEAGGAFDQIKEQMQQQASAFFADVKSAREEAMNNLEQDLTSAAEKLGITAPQTEPAPAVSTEKPSSEPITMAFKPEIQVSQANYQDFLQKFLDYTEKFRQQMFESFFNRKPTAKEPLNLLETELNNLGKTAEISESE